MADTHPPDSGENEVPMPPEEQPILIQSPIQGDARRLDENLEIPAEPDFVMTDNESLEETSDPGVSEAVAISDAPPEVAGPKNSRAFSLDALRGLFLISMTYGFTVDYTKFPGWMYHRQFPYDGAFTDIAGLTWRDLAYAAFLFTMAAALPLTLTQRMEKGEMEVSILMAIIRRGFLLLVFALLVGHSNTFFTGYTDDARILALVGFLIMAMIFTRRRPNWNPIVFRAINLIGWLAAIAFLALSPMLYGKGIDMNRVDDIMVGLAFASVTGSLIWYLTRENIPVRVGILGLMVAAYLGAKGTGWVADLWWSQTIPLFRVSMLILLAVVIPGTIAGDLLIVWIRRSVVREGRIVSWSNARILGLAFVCAMMTPVAVFGLYNRWVVETAEIILGMIVGGVFLTWRPTTEAEALIRKFFLWAALWLLAGLLLEPFEGGIHKVPDTLSYFFTVTGLTSMLLVAFFCSIDLLRRRRIAAPFIDVGHNPLMTYVLYTVLLNSIAELIPLTRGALLGSPGEAILKSVLSTALVVLIVQFMSRRKIFWRT